MDRPPTLFAHAGSGNCLHWFRLGLRLHDNPALLRAICEARDAKRNLFCVFIVDRTRFQLPESVDSRTRMSAARHKFLHECLQDLDSSLTRRGSKLFILHGEPISTMERILSEWKIELLTYERDIAPHSLERDRKVEELAKRMSVRVFAPHSKSLLDLDQMRKVAGGRIPLTYNGFQKLFSKCGDVPAQVDLPDGNFPEPDYDLMAKDDRENWIDTNPFVSKVDLKFPGGETEALARLERSLADEKWVAKFEKPQTSPNSLEPATTVLSPYISMGCLSPRLFWHRIAEVYRRRKNHSEPPVSLHGQMLFREYFHAVGYTTQNFGSMRGNAICKQIPWGDDDELLYAWEHSQTGYPFIDAIMTQLREEGWIHHLARHAVACFLTRGDLWQSWEKGAAVFEKYLLDGDWSMNIANWLWLSASAFFHQYFRVYSPVAFGKKTDPNGDYIRKYLPVLSKMPAKYIYEPWTAPKEVQKRANCVIGKDYPRPIVDHSKVSKENMAKMKAAYSDQKSTTDDEDEKDRPKPKRRKR